MKSTVYGLILYIVLILPPVANLLESIMVLHMHMQMPLLMLAGFLMAPFFQRRFPRFLKMWNRNGIPGILLFMIIWSYWMIPRAMDDALTIQAVQVFKFISLPFLAGLPLGDSWKKLTSSWKNVIFIFITVMLYLVGSLYLIADDQLCNNYLIVEQKMLGWSSLAMGVCTTIYLLQLYFVDLTEYEEAQ
ncbi:hypothetical protein [Paenisporosarcina antarctica]|uniref:Cytochrome c oxidase assembly protein n=1 Tax=Paenisporosarcina antarctica TaxID=417367 RepID=A0A4P7A194_9BACL|nr:hypothetical protein [Paenisporosarcina antarctica]QBP42602.1 hypothetical protein E2636_16255 [Paenisporosarcina antarctica]